MSPSSYLMKEHVTIKEALNVMNAMMERLRSCPEKMGLQEVEHLVDFLQSYTETIHHLKEEEFMFMAIVHMEGKTGQEAIKKLMEEHMHGRQVVAKISHALTQLQAGKRQATGTFLRTMEKYQHLLAEHIQDEEEIFYPLAASYLTIVEKKELLEKFVATDHLNQNKIKTLLSLLTNLKHHYQPHSVCS